MNWKDIVENTQRSCPGYPTRQVCSSSSVPNSSLNVAVIHPRRVRRMYYAGHIVNDTALADHWDCDALAYSRRRGGAVLYASVRHLPVGTDAKGCRQLHPRHRAWPAQYSIPPVGWPLLVRTSL